MRWGILVAAVALFCSAVAVAQAPVGRTVAVLGEGNISCGQWLKARQLAADGATILMTGRFAAEAWVLGYVSAFNGYGLTVSKNVAEGTDVEGIFAWIDQFCRKQPLENVLDATTMLVVELQRRSGAR
jgi:hypothetical protein